MDSTQEQLSQHLSDLSDYVNDWKQSILTIDCSHKIFNDLNIDYTYWNPPWMELILEYCDKLHTFGMTAEIEFTSLDVMDILMGRIYRNILERNDDIGWGEIGEFDLMLLILAAILIAAKSCQATNFGLCDQIIQRISNILTDNQYDIGDHGGIIFDVEFFVLAQLNFIVPQPKMYMVVHLCLYKCYEYIGHILNYSVMKEIADDIVRYVYLNRIELRNSTPPIFNNDPPICQTCALNITLSASIALLTVRLGLSHSDSSAEHLTTLIPIISTYINVQELSITYLMDLVENLL